jgi:hypothetical protein
MDKFEINIIDLKNSKLFKNNVTNAFVAKRTSKKI